MKDVSYTTVQIKNKFSVNERLQLHTVNAKWDHQH